MGFKFKIGDRVKILDGSKINRYAGGWCSAGMNKYCGSISTVIERGTTADGTTTRAKLYDGHKLIRESKAICSKDDTFDFEAGAKIAFERLTAKTAEPKPKKELKLLNTKIFVIDGYNEFKSGCIYEIKDGQAILGDGWKYPVCGRFYSMDDVHKYFNGKSDSKYNSAGYGMGGYSTKKKVTVMEVKEG